MSEFGKLLRTARQERRLSQSDVGGGKYSASYISHLELGRRFPTPEVVEFLARQLGLPVSHLRVAEVRDERDAQAAADLAVAELEMQDALVDHDYATVISVAGQIGANAAETNPTSWWRARRLRAEAHLLSGDYAACVDLTTELVSSQLTRFSPQLRGSLLALRSRALRALGLVDEALAAATDASAAASTAGSPQLTVTALLAEIAARSELGQLEEAGQVADRLVTSRQDLPPGQLLGLAAWAIGNVWFLLGRTADAIAEHDLAAANLRADSDLRDWARFHKASAALRVAAGVRDGVDELVDRARQGLALVGNASDRAELRLLEAELELETNPATAMALVDEALASVKAPHQTVAEAETLRSRALERLGRSEEARAALLTAAEEFEAAGAHDRATPLWRRLAVTAAT